jgi:hypothetical protein
MPDLAKLAEAVKAREMARGLAHDVGALLLNLLALEFMARDSLMCLDGRFHDADIFGKLRPGDVVDEHHLSDYSSLGPLLNRYNASARPSERVDVAQLVKLRDMLAHGRVGAELSADEMSLIKFAKPEGGKATVEAVVVLAQPWLMNQSNFVKAAIDVVVATGQRWAAERPTPPAE